MGKTRVRQGTADHKRLKVPLTLKAGEPFRPAPIFRLISKISRLLMNNGAGILFN